MVFEFLGNSGHIWAKEGFWAKPSMVYDYFLQYGLPPKHFLNSLDTKCVLEKYKLNYY